MDASMEPSTLEHEERRQTEGHSWLQHKPLVSVIILNLDGAKFLRGCISSVLASDYDRFELIVVDNGSTDDSMAVLAYFSDERIRVLRNKSNLGFAEGNNVGSKIAKGEFLLFLNNDTFVDRLWLSQLLKAIEADPGVAIAQSKLVSLRDKGRTIDSRGDFIDIYGEVYCRDQGLTNRPETGDVEEVFSARGAAMMIRRAVFFKVGMFDPDFFLSLEDVDLSWRVRLNGWKVIYVPSSVVYHEGAATYSPVKSYHHSKNFYMLLPKNCTTRSLIVYFPRIILINSMGLISNVLGRRREEVVHSLRVYKWVFSHLSLIWRKRVVVQRLRRNNATDFDMMLKPTLRQYTRYLIDMHSSWSNNAKGQQVQQAYLRSLTRTLLERVPGEGERADGNRPN